MRTLHIGVGGRGGWPVEQYAGRAEIDIVGLCDIREEALARAREITGLGEDACFDDYRRAIDTVDCDAVIVVTPPPLHAEMCLAAVRAGRHVLVEKPFCTRLADACEIVREAEARGVKVQVANNRRYGAKYVAAASFCRSAAFGGVAFGLYTTFGWRPGVHHSGDDPHAYAWERGIHDVDTVWALTGGRPAAVRALSFNPAWSPYRGGAGMSAIVECTTGAVVTLSCCFMSHRRGGEFRVDGPGGTLEVNKLHWWKPGAAEAEPVAVPEGPPSEVALTDAWLAWIAGGPEPPTGMLENLWTVATIEAIGVSSDRGEIVDIGAYLRRWT